MKRTGSVSEIVESREVGGSTLQLHASAEADYVESRGGIEVTLTAKWLRVNQRGRDQELKASWLPAEEKVFEAVDQHEAGDALHAIFKSWVRRVREAIPSTLEGRDLPRS